MIFFVIYKLYYVCQIVNLGENVGWSNGKGGGTYQFGVGQHLNFRDILILDS